MKNPGLFPALNQGKQFTTYQTKIANTIEEKMANPFMVKEGFESLTKETNQVIQQKGDEDQSSLRQMYETTLKQYQDLMTSISGATTSYLSRISTNNPYLNKLVQFTTGEICYVTNQGVVKKLADKTVMQTIPSIAAMKPVTLSVPWIPAYDIPGTQIPTNPPLVSGTNLIAGQSVGNEGSNVFVNSYLPATAKASFLGCFQNNNSLTYIGNAPPVATEPVTILNGSFSQPVLSSNSYKYYTGYDIPNWTFDNAVILNNSTAWAYPMPYPDGNQCVSLQNNASISQAIKLSVGVTYTITYWACGRNCCTGAKTNPLRVEIITTNKGYVIPPFGKIPPIDKWTQYSYTFMVPTSNVFLLRFSGTNNNYNGDQSSAIQGISITASESPKTGGTYTFEQCQQAAIEQGYPYFGLQNVNTTTSQGYCAVSKSEPAVSQNGESKVANKQNIAWSSNTGGQPGNVATLSPTGALQVMNASGMAVYSTPSSNATPANYLGCYGDKSERAIPTFANNEAQQYNLQQCQQYAQSGGYKLFGLQNSESGTTAQCAVSNSMDDAMKYGRATNCTKLADGTWTGGGFSNALYNTSVGASNYTLELGDNYMQICRGKNPVSDNQGVIWKIDFPKREKNSNYVASKCKFNQNWFQSSQTMAAGDWIGSPNGYAALVMQTDGNLVLITFEMGSNCSKMTDGNMGGGVGANAFYKLGKTAVPNNMGKLAFVDANADLHSYPDSNASYLNKYTFMKGVSSTDTDIPGASFANATVEKCQAACDQNADCAGFVTNAAGDYCWPQTKSMYPYKSKGVLNADRNTYIRNKVPTSPPIGVSQKTYNIDTVTYQEYANGGAIDTNKYGLTKATTAQQQQLSQLQQRLNSLAIDLSKTTGQVVNTLSDVQTQSQRNTKGLNIYLDSLQSIDERVNSLPLTNEMQNIVSESDLVVLQKNYDYIFWSILATGTVLVAMNI